MDKNQEKKIEKILNRGVAAIYPSKEKLKERLLSEEKMRIYLGIDPTGPDLHLGHGIGLRKLREFQKLGHETILLIGDFTGMIGDPTGKNSTRVQLTREEVLKNCKDYTKQAGKILDFKDKKNPTKIMFNSKWLDKLTFLDIIKIASFLTVSQVLNREMFQERIKGGREIALHELLYPMMQGYDSVAMDIDMEIGGNDQIFNMLVGRDLMKKIKNKEKFVLGTKLLVDPSGKKMGKTEGNIIKLKDNPDEMFGKVMSWPDELISVGFEVCTDLDYESFSCLSPRDQKIRLAYEIVKIYHDKKSALSAQKKFQKIFQEKKLDEKDIEKIKGKKGEKILDILIRENIISSKSEGKRLFTAGAIDFDGNMVSDFNSILEKDVVIKVGKKIFIKILAQ